MDTHDTFIIQLLFIKKDYVGIKGEKRSQTDYFKNGRSSLSCSFHENTRRDDLSMLEMTTILFFC